MRLDCIPLLLSLLLLQISLVFGNLSEHRWALGNATNTDGVRRGGLACDQCYTFPGPCQSSTVPNYLSQRLTCSKRCCTVKFSVWSSDDSSFQVQIFDAPNFALFSDRTGSRAYAGWTSREYICESNPGTAPICSQEQSETLDLYFVVLCKNSIASCKISYSASAESWNPSFNQDVCLSKNPLTWMILAGIGTIAIVVCVLALVIWMLRRCKARRKLCWALACCQPKAKPFESLPLDDLTPLDSQP